jgi:hypothetical protein
MGTYDEHNTNIEITNGRRTREIKETVALSFTEESVELIVQLLGCPLGTRITTTFTTFPSAATFTPCTTASPPVSLV